MAAPPAATADAAPPLTPAQARCRDLVAPFSPAEPPWRPAAIEPDGPDGCRFTAIGFRLNRFFGYRMDFLLVRGIPFERPEGPTPPMAVRVEARGITRVIPDQPPRMAWMLQMQQNPFDVTLDAAYDPGAATLVLHELSMDGPVAGHAAVRGTLERVRLRTGLSGGAPDLDSDPTLRSLHVDLDSRTILAAYAISLVSGMLPEDDPAAAFEAARAQVVAYLRTVLPATAASAETVDALVAFAGDFPRPAHPLALDVTTTGTLTPSTLSATLGDPARLLALLQTLTVTATYAGAIR